jgi:NAD-dependent deacetylase
MRRIDAAAPAPGHHALRRLERAGLLRAVITLSADTLHDAAGTRDVIELAGSLQRSVCPACGYSEPLGCVIDMLPLPRCAACGAVLRPNVVAADDAPLPVAFQRACQLARTGALLLLVDVDASGAPAREIAAAARDAGGRVERATGAALVHAADTLTADATARTSA